MADEDSTTVNTGLGPLSVPNRLLRTWNVYGWPEDRVLEAMIAEQQREVVSADD
ncbi:hypothetical protein ACIQRE_01845 [Streptomyces griseoluteus]|uniref:hypothetical protein n=1 Tax=Streptomyces griseoluteus TaxID=29306 RepID=UPI00382F759C